MLMLGMKTNIKSEMRSFESNEKYKLAKTKSMNKIISQVRY